MVRSTRRARPTPSSKRKQVSASFVGLRPASPKASRLAATASRKRATKCEMKLRRSIRKHGVRFTTNVASLPGCPDLVFPSEKVAVFADGDFWHGRRLASRLGRLARGHNAYYWINKIKSNVRRDQRVRRQLEALGWRVVRVWESEIDSEIDRATGRILHAVMARS
jgi:DNA mismatch endonuclease (patch repair protein)